MTKMVSFMRTFLPGAMKDNTHVEMESASFFDTAAEGFYHGMLLGFMAELRGSFRVLSNRESGFGRFDIALFPLLDGFPGVIIKAADADTMTSTHLPPVSLGQSPPERRISGQSTPTRRPTLMK